MKILLYQWKTYGNRFLEYHLQKMGHDIKTWSDDRITKSDESALPGLEKELREGYDMVFSYNYFKVIAIACHTKEIPYISWTLDSPMLSLYDYTAFYETNFFFCFDYEQVEGLKKRGISKAFYCPLATDINHMQSTANACANDEISRYKAGISFVGSLYTEKDMWLGLAGMPEFLKGYFDGIVETQFRLPSLRFSQTQIPLDVMKRIQQILNFDDIGQSAIRYEELVDNIIDRQVTVIERRRMVERLTQYSNFKLYTNSNTNAYQNLNNCGGVDYYTEMPKVFRHSDININVTLRSIRSGIPLRVLDVIASGGFLLTNVQPELELFFKEGESIVTFQSLEEMEDKIEYYLNHEKERKCIVENAYKIVANQFDYKVRLPQILEMSGI